MTAPPLALADTSLFIASDQQRRLLQDPPPHVTVSTITLAELELGVLAATDGAARARRLGTLRWAGQLEPLVIDDDVATAWARLRLALRDAGARMPVNDSWIAATAMAHGLSVVTEDDDYDVVPGLNVVKV